MADEGLHLEGLSSRSSVRQCSLLGVVTQFEVDGDPGTFMTSESSIVLVKK